MLSIDVQGQYMRAYGERLGAHEFDMVSRTKSQYECPLLRVRVKCLVSAGVSVCEWHFMYSLGINELD